MRPTLTHTGAREVYGSPPFCHWTIQVRAYAPTRKENKSRSIKLLEIYFKTVYKKPKRVKFKIFLMKQST
jgi:hypothetical protein